MEKEIIVVKNQKELDAIPLNFDGIIKIEDVMKKIIIKNRNNTFLVYWSEWVRFDRVEVEVFGNARVEAHHENIHVEAWDNSKIKAYGETHIVASGDACIEAYDMVEVEVLDDFASIKFLESSECEAYGGATVIAHDIAYVELNCNATILARNNVCVETYGEAIVKTYGNARVEYYDLFGKN